METGLQILDDLISKIEANQSVHRQSICYKFWTIDEWDKRKSMENIPGSDFDKNSGFIHMCTVDQCKMIGTRYFADKSEYFIIKMDINKIKKLQFDTNEHGTFPHAYTDLPKEAILNVFKVDNPKTFDFNQL
eukprot:365786_1